MFRSHRMTSWTTRFSTILALLVLAVSKSFGDDEIIEIDPDSPLTGGLLEFLRTLWQNISGILF